MKKFRQSQLGDIAAAIKRGAVVALPTETVYGLAVRFDDMAAVAQLAAIKERDYDSDKVFTLMLPAVELIKKYAVLDVKTENIISRYLPDELTVVLPKNPEFTNPYFDNRPTIGIRVPNHQFMLGLLALAGPLIVTSANNKGLIPALDSQSIERDLPEVDAVVEGQSGNQPPTTVVNFTTEKPTILRQGSVSLDLDSLQESLQDQLPQEEAL
ncbi:MAG: threonylcarbamoyl-AMP synthase [Candidatus Nomurabacteria bacterium]|jgi:L-threonylcarbamoyladenylate synthase|nr:threonylcarbamoyl-AMP synthase [Candidatus Nomurabacteria bacterium]